MIDLKAGRAVHAQGGERELYEPVRGPLLSKGQVGDAGELARAYRGIRGLAEIYVADLTAIAGPSGEPQDYTAITQVGLPVMVDAGVTTVDDAVRVSAAGATRVVVGLETLVSLEDLLAIVQGVGAERVVFSLDMRDGRGVTRSGAPFSGLRPMELVGHAASAGVSAVLLLDLGRVGRAVGVDHDLVRHARGELRGLELLVGGGVRDASDLRGLAALGCDGVLLGTALLEGRITAWG